jgi:uncharacterized protein
MLSFNVSELLKSPPGTTRDVGIEEDTPDLGPDLAVSAPIVGSARFCHSGSGILVDCELRTSVTLECARCLNAFEKTVSAQFEEEFSPTVNVTTGTPLPPPEDEALTIDDRHVLDLTEAVRQYLLTTLPMKPVCSPSCRGLCATCGADLNADACGCDAEPVTGPLAELARLVPRSEDVRRSEPA